MCYEAELSLDGTPLSIRVGRRFVADALCRWGVGTEDRQAAARVDEILLVASELLANAVRATSRTAGLHVEAHQDHVIVSVRDDSTGPVRVRKAAPGDTRGRGLSIVEALSDRWGTTPVGEAGKVVWSKMAISAPSLSEHCFL